MATFTGGTAFGITSDFSGFRFVRQLPTNATASRFSFVGLLSGPSVPSTQVRVTVDGNNLFYRNINGISVPVSGLVEQVTVVAVNTAKGVGSIEFPGAGVNILQVSRIFPLLPAIFAQNDRITGTDFNDRLLGYNGQDILFGKLGNDTLNGGAGNDTLVGGIGRDIYYVDSSTDIIVEASSIPSEIDLVFSSASSFILRANVEQLVLQAGAIAGTGNAFNNSIFGNAANNRLSGGAGNDTLNGGAGNDLLIGGAGNDIYYVDSSADVISEASSSPSEIDFVFSSANSFILRANVEQLVLQAGAIAGTGNAFNNSIFGNAANNRLSGGAGNDTLNGGAGNDVLIGGTGRDIYYVNSNTDVISEASSIPSEIDLVFSSASNFVLRANVEQLVLQASAIAGTGNAFNNSIFGNAANNRLSGGAGNDTLNGGAGNDILVGGAGNDLLVGATGLDRFIFNAPNEGIDTIVNFSVSDDAIAVSAAGFGGGLSAGVTLAPTQFTIGAATTSNHRFIYNQTSGALFFDRDGLGGIEQIQIARFSGGLAMTSEDFFVIA